MAPTDREYIITLGEDEHSRGACPVCHELLTLNDAIAVGQCCNLHYDCALEHYRGTAPNNRKSCPGCGVTRFKPPPVSVQYVRVNAPHGVACTICMPFSDSPLETGVFLRVECEGQHVFHADCLLAFNSSCVENWGLYADNLETWRNLPCPMCRTPCDTLTMLGMEMEANPNTPVLPTIVHIPRANTPPPVQGAVTIGQPRQQPATLPPAVVMQTPTAAAHAVRRTTFQLGYDSLPDATHGAIKRSASTAAGGEDLVMFTQQVVGMDRNTADAIKLNLLYKPDPASPEQYQYMVVASRRETVAAIGKVWLSALWGFPIDPTARKPLFRHAGRVLGWQDTLQALGLTEFDSLTHDG